MEVNDNISKRLNELDAKFNEFVDQIPFVPVFTMFEIHYFKKYFKLKAKIKKLNAKFEKQKREVDNDNFE